MELITTFKKITENELPDWSVVSDSEGQWFGINQVSPWRLDAFDLQQFLYFPPTVHSDRLVCPSLNVKAPLVLLATSCPSSFNLSQVWILSVL